MHLVLSKELFHFLFKFWLIWSIEVANVRLDYLVLSDLQQAFEVQCRNWFDLEN
jgi:hypothetical protein